MTQERDYDVVVFGATGFTGRLVARYLAGQTGVRWAIAGRDEARLRQVKEELGRELGGAEVGILVADKSDERSLIAMAERTKVVLTTVGPYAQGGEVVVSACIAAGAHYVDITGEPDFVDAVRARFDEKARERGVRVVSCCGFDSIPHDLGALFTVKALPEGEPITLEGFVRAKGDPSGGTWQSAILAMSQMGKTGKAGKGEKAGKSKDRASGPRTPLEGGRQVRSLKARLGYRRDMRGWAFPLPTIDPQVIRRSAQARSDYGPDFRFAHYGLVRSLRVLAAGAAGVGALLALSQLGPTRRWLLNWRQSGEGPSEEKRARSWFEVTFIGQSATKRVITRVRGGDPGYDETAKMAAESALCLAHDDLRQAAGVLTPAVAMGEPLIARLQAAGIGFEVVEEQAI